MINNGGIMAEFNWETKSNMENSIFDTIIYNYTVKELCENVKEEKDDYVGTAKSAKFCYDSFANEINEVVSISKARSLAAGSTDYDDIKSIQVSEAIKLIMKDIYDDYKEIFIIHPDKNVSDIINEDYCYHWMGDIESNTYKSYKTVEDFIKNEFLCNEILTAQKSSSNINQLSSRQCCLISAVFYREIESKAKANKDKIDSNPLKSMQCIVSEHISDIYDKVVKENKEAIIKHPCLKIKEAIAKEKSNQNEEIEK